MTPTDPSDAPDQHAAALPHALRAALSSAIRGRDRAAVSALRSAIAAVENAEAVEVQAPAEGDARFAGSATGLGAGEAERRTLTTDEVAAVVHAEVAERRAAAQEFTGLGREDQAQRLHAEADVIQQVLDAAPR